MSVSASSLTNPVKEGYLIKQSGQNVTNWQKRWFVLHSHKLYYFETNKAKSPKGIIPLEGCCVKMVEEEYFLKEKHPYCFMISQPDRTYFITSKEEGEAKEWCAAVRKETTNLKNRTFVAKIKHPERFNGLLSYHSQNDPDTKKLIYLLKNGADPNADDAVYQAVTNANAQLRESKIRLLFQGGLNESAPACTEALALAATRGYDSTVQLLLEEGVNPNTVAKVKDGSSALLLAASADPEAAAVGATSFVPTGDKDGFYKSIVLLLEKKADVNTTNAYSQNCLILSAARGRHDLLELLLSQPTLKPELIDHQDDQGKTALFHALHAGYTKCANPLLARGASLTLRDKTGVTVRDAANDTPYSASVDDYFEERQNNPNAGSTPASTSTPTSTSIPQVDARSSKDSGFKTATPSNPNSNPTFNRASNSGSENVEKPKTQEAKIPTAVPSLLPTQSTTKNNELASNYFPSPPVSPHSQNPQQTYQPRLTYQFTPILPTLTKDRGTSKDGAQQTQPDTIESKPSANIDELDFGESLLDGSTS